MGRGRADVARDREWPPALKGRRCTLGRGGTGPSGEAQRPGGRAQGRRRPSAGRPLAPMAPLAPVPPWRRLGVGVSRGVRVDEMSEQQVGLRPRVAQRAQGARRTEQHRPVARQFVLRHPRLDVPILWTRPALPALGPPACPRRKPLAGDTRTADCPPRRPVAEAPGPEA